jgi:hypothetical protein
MKGVRLEQDKETKIQGERGTVIIQTAPGGGRSTGLMCRYVLEIELAFTKAGQ